MNFLMLNFSKPGMVVDQFKWDNFPFGKEIKFQMDFELKIQEFNQI
jgi:hypothetical protein